MDTLQFRPAIRHGGNGKHEQHYQDFVVSGRSLRTVLGRDDSDLITSFGWLNSRYEEEQLQVLLLHKQSDVPTGRAMLYVCPECGDLDCGAITATILDLGDRIVWTDFGYETGYGGLVGDYITIKPIEFRRQQYVQTLSRLGVRLAVQWILHHR